MKVTTTQFKGCGEWNQRLIFIAKYLDTKIKDTESIAVDASGFREETNIVVYIQTVCNNHSETDLWHLNPSLMCSLSDCTVQVVIDNLLSNFRIRCQGETR
jgi:hypothetical protein